MLTGFDHINIRTANLDAMIAWYSDILGLQNGPGPDFRFPGAWLYLNETAVVHLVGVEVPPTAGGDLALEHAALRARGLTGFLAKLDAAGIAYRLSPLEAVQNVQVNISDPDGNHLHIDFDLSEMPA